MFRIILVIFITCSSLPICADISDYVFLIEPIINNTAQQFFSKIASDCDEMAGSISGSISDSILYSIMKKSAEIFRDWEKGGVSGSGFLYVSESGDKFVITNRHVVESSLSDNANGKYKVSDEKGDGRKYGFEECPIIYVDDIYDLAIIELTSRKFTQGLTLLETDLNKIKGDKVKVFAFGYPSILGKTSFLKTEGALLDGYYRNDSLARIFRHLTINDPSLNYVIMHRAEIDYGNSGGPLMIENPSSSVGYAVIGVNTAVAQHDYFFAIPTKYVKMVIEEARRSKKIFNNDTLLYKSLISRCKDLSIQLTKNEIDTFAISNYFSHNYLIDKGWETFQQIMKNNTQAFPVLWNALVSDPLATLKNAVMWNFVDYFQLRDKNVEVKFDTNSIDFKNIKKKSTVSTAFSIGYKKCDIIWVYEWGNWRIRKFEINSLFDPDKTNDTIITFPDKKGATNIGNNYLKLDLPADGEKWKRGTTQKITWTSQAVTAPVLLYTLDDGASWKAIAPPLITDSQYGSWYYNWYIPDTLQQSNRCKIGIVDYYDTLVWDISKQFSITGDVPEIKIITPAGGEKWKRGTTQKITWTSQGVTAPFLTYTIDEGASWKAIAPPLKTGAQYGIWYYDWYIPDTLQQSNRYKIGIIDLYDTLVVSVGQQFSIVRGRAKIGGTVFLGIMSLASGVCGYLMDMQVKKKMDDNKETFDNYQQNPSEDNYQKYSEKYGENWDKAKTFRTIRNISYGCAGGFGTGFVVTIVFSVSRKGAK